MLIIISNKHITTCLLIFLRYMKNRTSYFTTHNLLTKNKRVSYEGCNCHSVDKPQNSITKYLSTPTIITNCYACEWYIKKCKCTLS